MFNGYTIMKIKIKYMIFFKMFIVTSNGTCRRMYLEMYKRIISKFYVFNNYEQFVFLWN